MVGIKIAAEKNIALPLKLGTRIQSMGRVWSYFMTCDVRIMLGEETVSIDQIPDSDLNISGLSGASATGTIF